MSGMVEDQILEGVELQLGTSVRELGPGTSARKLHCWNLQRLVPKSFEKNTTQITLAK
jgi:hypothetical protein